MSTKARDTHVSRDRIPDQVRLALWAKTAGRCTICNRRLLGDSRTFLHSVLAAELAHNVGATSTKGSPRGNAEDIDDRESEENLLLVCHDCHRIIDAKDHVEFFPTERLRGLKNAHELRIERVTSTGLLTRTAVIRVGANVKKSPSIATQREVAETLFASDYLGLVESQWSGDFTCRLVGHATERAYWMSAQDRIDATLDVVTQAVERGDIEHISVFAIAPIPVLVYLGSRLDDKVGTRIYEKQRGDAKPAWAWIVDSPVINFEHHEVSGAATAEDVVLACSVTAPVQPTRLPDDLAGAPIFDLRPVNVAPAPGLMTNEASLKNFGQAWRTMLAAAEAAYPNAKRWHLVAAAPVSVCVEAGRSFMRSAQPQVHVYEGTGSTYTSVIEVNQ